MTNQVAKVEPAGSAWKGFYRIGAMAAMIVFGLFLVGIVGIISVGLQLTTADGWFTQLQDNWLVVLFKLNVGFQPRLDVLNLLDIAIMALFCVMFLALYVALKRTSKVWSLVAASLPFLGIPPFLITGTAGRSALLIAGLINSAVMLRSKIFGKATAYVGIVASALLFFAGDIATAMFSSSSVIAVFIAVGYVFWMVWFCQVACRLYQLGKGVSKDVNR